MEDACICPSWFPAIQFWSYTARKRLAFPRPRNWKFQEKLAQNWKEKAGQTCVSGLGHFFKKKKNHSDRDFALWQTARDPTRLIRPRPIDCGRRSDQPVKVSLFWNKSAIFFFWIGSLIWAPSTPPKKLIARFSLPGVFFRATKMVRLYCFLGEVSFSLL